MNLLNLASFLMRRPSALPVLAAKVRRRFGLPVDHRSVATWTAANSQSSADIARRIAPDLWSEAEVFGHDFETRAARLLATVRIDMGGGGDHRFLYWLTRYTRPTVAVETGVSAGWSTTAILTAMARNDRGHLYSSDFPFFRAADPEQAIGLLVPQDVRNRWTLHTTGDDRALPSIVAACESVDLFHYDSDKTRAGRERGMATVLPRLAPGGIAIMDDILNDDWFMRFAERAGRPWRVLDGRAGMLGEVHAQSPCASSAATTSSSVGTPGLTSRGPTT